jgi:hypothetical protein
LDFRPCLAGQVPNCNIYFTFKDDDNLYYDTWTITWLNVPYYCRTTGQITPECRNGPTAQTASFQVTLFPDGRIKMQYKELHPNRVRNWAPVSVGLEGVTGFDGIQASFDDDHFPRNGTAIGFTASCGMAGENDCDVADVDRTETECSLFLQQNPQCNIQPHSQPSAACVAAFCGHTCFGEAYNLRQDCVVNPRANINASVIQQIQQIAGSATPVTDLVGACPAPDTGETIPIEFQGGAYCPVLNTYIAVHGGMAAWVALVQSGRILTVVPRDELDEICHEWNQNRQVNPCYRSTTSDPNVVASYSQLCAGGRGAHLGPAEAPACVDDPINVLGAFGATCADVLAPTSGASCTSPLGSLYGMRPGTTVAELCPDTCQSCAPGTTMTVHAINARNQCGESTFPSEWAAGATAWLATQSYTTQPGTCASAGFTESVTGAGATSTIPNTGAPTDPVVTLYTQPAGGGGGGGGH